MFYRRRVLEREILRAVDHFGAILVTGPRRSGKSTLLRHLFPQAKYFLLQDPDLIARIRADPHGFLDNIELPVILDEIQNTPEIFAYIRTLIDASPNQKGQWLLTGSQEAPLMQGVSESMAGRVALFSLLPFSYEEASEVSLLRGGFPEVIQAPEVADIWFRSYIQTYLERDVRAITAVRDLSTFRRFLGLLASRCGQTLNKSDLAAPLGISVPALTQWLSILEITGQIFLVPPYYENFGKKVLKTPKLYFADSGLAAALLGISQERELATSPFRGALFEGLVASEIIKHRQHRGKDRGLYMFRDRQGFEVDFVLVERAGRIVLIEVKASQTPKPDDGRRIGHLAETIRKKDNFEVKAIVVHAGTERYKEPMPLAPGVQAISWTGLAAFFEG